MDQCAEVGFEMVIMTFGSGFDIENEDPAYLAQIKELVDYAHSKGIELGRLLAAGQPQRSAPSQRRDQSEDRQARRRHLRQFALPGQPLGQDYFRKLYDLLRARPG